MAIQGFRLVTGEVLLAQVTLETAEFFEIKDAAMLITQETEPGKMGVGLQPFVPYAKGSIKIFKYSINAMFGIDVMIENEYSRIFGSGIQIAGANQMPRA